MFAYASRRLANRDDAEDAAADTFQAAFSHLGKLQGGDARLWLLGIARRKVADIHRKRRRRREQPLDEGIALATGTDKLAEDADRVASIRRIVLALPDDQREALLLQYVEGLTVAQIAVVIRRSPSAVNSLLQRARARAFREGKAYFLEDQS